MKRLRIKILLAMCIVPGVLVMYFVCLPVTEVIDGCECGHLRRWYEMPNSPWPRAKLLKRTEVSGNATHEHQYWDSQWAVWFAFPWQK